MATPPMMEIGPGRLRWNGQTLAPGAEVPPEVLRGLGQRKDAAGQPLDEWHIPGFEACTRPVKGSAWVRPSPGAGDPLLDDLGAHNSTAWARTQIVSLVDSRYRTGGRLLVATNLLSPAAMAKDMGEGRVASRLFERSSTVCVAWVNAGDYRLEGQP